MADEIDHEIESILKDLKPRSAQILRWRYGLNGKKYSAEEIADMTPRAGPAPITDPDRTSVRGQRIAQIEAMAFRVLKKNGTISRFAELASLKEPLTRGDEDRFKKYGVIFPERATAQKRAVRKKDLA